MNIDVDCHNADTISVDTLYLEHKLIEDRSKEITKLEALGKTVCNLHTNILYYRNASTRRGAVCYEAWKSIVKNIGGSPNTWRELGNALGVAHDDLNYIGNLYIHRNSKVDPADIVIKVYMQNESATLDKIVDALVKMSRYDILKAIEEPFCNLSQYFNKKDDSGYQSENKTTGQKRIFFTNEIDNDLPAVLNKNYVTKDKEPKPNQPTLIPPPTNDREIDDNSPILFLTYTEDGVDTAINIQHYINDWEGQRVTVLTLCNKKDQVYQNPEKFIRKYFEKADFIVPIITPGYLKSINPLTSHEPSATDNLDYKYVNFIYNLIINYYIHATGCLNNKVRSVLPYGVNINVLKEITMYPDLLPYTYESNFNEHFKVFLKKKLS